MRGLATAAALASVACMPPEWGANGLLHPMRRHLVAAVDLPHEDVAFRSDGLLLKGWLFRANGVRRGLIVHLHGVADNRRSGVGIAQRFVPKGYDVLTYDSRAHGESEGKDCTYGFYEKRDLRAALDAIHAEDAILFGSSLGAAVALQTAAEDPRIRGVIAQSAFSDLETIARERAPWVATSAEIAEALAIAERNGHFRIAEVSPWLAASRIRVPVLLIHGEKDRETSAAHSRRIYDALGGPRRLLLVPGRGHNDALRDEGTWTEIEAWVDALPSAGRLRGGHLSSRHSRTAAVRTSSDVSDVFQSTVMLLGPYRVAMPANRPSARHRRRSVSTPAAWGRLRPRSRPWPRFPKRPPRD